MSNVTTTTMTSSSADSNSKSNIIASSTSSTYTSTPSFIRGDLTTFQVITTTRDMDWVVSPTAGVDRRMLDRIGAEVARATSLVRYAENGSFPEHTHAGGEEFLVLSGVFSDTISGDMKQGDYLRHPIGSKHGPWSKPGCVLLVKLRQMTDLSESDVTHIHTADPNLIWNQHSDGRQSLLLFHSNNTGEDVQMEKLPANTILEWIVAKDGEELFVVSGSFTDTYDNTTSHVDPEGWMRRPYTQAEHKIIRKVGAEGATIWIKRGHLGQDMIAATTKV